MGGTELGEEIPSRIGKYEVDSILGRGGMGIVYKGRDTLGREVAIKMMLESFAGESELIKRFHREAQFTANLHHPNIVTIYDWGQEGNSPYIVMEYLSGRSLDRWRIEGPPPMVLLKKLNTIEQVCAGLKYAHDNKIVHRDIKPPNIFVQDNESVKLLDFGVARLAEGAGHAMTRTGQVIGSLYYMSPEQANGQKLDHRTDLFSTGVVLYQLLSGVLPFAGRDTTVTITRILTTPPRPLSEILANCPPALEEVVNRALEKAPRDRYQTAEELALDLSMVQTQLRRQIATEYLESAEAAIERSDWLKAKDILVELLKLDRDHARGLDLLREVQQIVRRQDRVSEASGLKSQAEEALEGRRFKDALDLAEEAVSLDNSNYDLVVFRDEVRARLNRAEKAGLAVERAESSLHAQKLEAAQSAVNEALSLDPFNTLAQQLQNRISQALADQFKRSQVQTMMRQARQELAERRYTSALVLLRKVEALDGSAPDLNGLFQQAIQGQERERREREVHSLTDEIRKLISSMDLDLAEAKLSGALGRFSGEQRLLELKRNLTEVRQTENARLAVERAERSLVSGQLEAAQSAIDEALSLAPFHARAQELQSAISQAVAERARQAHVQSLLDGARQELAQRYYANALALLEQAKGLNPAAPDLRPLLEQAQQGLEREKRQRELDAVSAEIRKLIAAREFDRAEAMLAKALARYSAEPQLQDLQRELALVRKTETLRLALDRAEKYLLAQRFEEAQSALDEALSLDPYNLAAKQLQARISQGQVERQKRSQAQSLLDQARQALAQGSWTPAIALLRKAESLDAAIPDLPAMLQQATQGQEKEGRQREVGALTTEIRKLIPVKEFDRAEATLATALTRFSAEPQLLEIQRELAQERRQERVRLAVERAQSCLLAERFEEALNAVNEALSLDPGYAPAKQLNARISQALADRQKRSQAQSFLEQARQALAQRNWAAAIAVLKQVQSLDAAIPDLPALLQQAMQGQEKEARERELSDLTNTVTKLVSRGNFDSAGETLATARSRFQDAPQLLELERKLALERKSDALRGALERSEGFLRAGRLEDAQSALDQALALDSSHEPSKQLQSRISQALAERQKRSQMQSLLEQARQAIAQRNFAGAATLLRKAEKLDAANPDLSALLQQAAQGQEKEGRERELSDLRDAVVKLISSKNFDRAEAALAGARSRFQREPQLLELERNLALERKSEGLRGALERAESCLREGRFDDAQRAVDEALSLDSSNQPAKQFQARIAQALADRQKRSQTQSLLDQARKALAERNFAGAISLLRKAESIDAAAPDLSALFQQAVQGQEREKLERELNELRDALTKLVSGKKFDRAEAKLAGARSRFAGEPLLAELERYLAQERAKAEPPAQPAPAPAKPKPTPAPAKPVASVPSPTVISSTSVFTPPVEKAHVQPPRQEPAQPAVEPEQPVVRPSRGWLVWASLGAVALAGIVWAIVFLAPAPKPAAVQFTILTTPAGASIHVDGNGQSLNCITPKCALSLPPGNYRLQTALAGYLPVARTLSAVSGMAPLAIQLTPRPLVDTSPAAGPAAVLVVQTPGVRDALVYIDGAGYAATGAELRFTGSLKKTYRVLVEKDGYTPSSEQMLTLAHPTVTVVVPLKRLANAATVVIRSATPRADVLIDGKNVGAVEANGSFEGSVPSGFHTVQLTSGGRMSNQFSGQFNPSQRVEIASLTVSAPVQPQPQPAPAPPQPQPQVDPAEQEWNAVQSTTDENQLNAFLQRHPTGPYADQAHARLEALDWSRTNGSNDRNKLQAYLDRHGNEAHGQQAREQLEQLDWDAVKNSGDDQRLQAFLNSYPQGKFAGSARTLLQTIRDQKAADDKKNKEAADAKKAADGLLAAKAQQAADEHSVRDAMNAYRQAYESKNIDRLRQIWPNMSVQEANNTEQSFHAASAIHVTLQERSLKVTGDTAQADCAQTMQIVAGGMKQTVANSATFSFQKRSGTWVIDRVVYGKAH